MAVLEQVEAPVPAPAAGKSEHRLDAALAIGVFALAFAVYNRTLTPSLSYSSPDGDELATVPYKLGLAHMPGYPLYTWLGRLFTLLPVGDVAHRMNLMSALSAAGAAALVYGICRVLDMRRPAAVFGALLLAFSLTLWSQAVITEVYAPNAFMLALTFLLLLAWGRREEGLPPRTQPDRTSLALFWGFALAFGLSLGTHLSDAALALPAIVYVLLVNRRVLAQRRLLIVGAAFFLLGVAQYAWLPLRAATLNDPLMVQFRPDTWDGFLNYTVRAFSNLRFAFPWSAVPYRVVLYLKFAGENFRFGGLLLPIIGLWGLLFQRTKPFFLLVGFYTVELVFFTQYAVFDLDVFFIPAHLVTAVFAAYGVHGLLRVGPPALTRLRVPAGAAYWGLVALAMLPVLSQLGRNWDSNDRSRDTSINDFYRNVFAVLPRGATLVGGRGVFGYDMFYFRQTEGVRPDVSMPMMEAPRATDEGALRQAPLLFTTTLPEQGQAARTPFSAAGLLPPDRWYVPLLAAPMSGQPTIPRRSLVLYEARSQPPDLVVPDARPEHAADRDVGGLHLVGYDVGSAAAPGGVVRVKLYWRMTRVDRYYVTVRLGSGGPETHELGFGNLERYVRETGRRDGVIVEDYGFVVLSSTTRGDQSLTVSVGGAPSGLFGMQTDDSAIRLELAKVRVDAQ